jgi:hypothetical protein
MSHATHSSTFTFWALAIGCLFTCACSSAPVTAPPSREEKENEAVEIVPDEPDVTGKVWLATDPSAAPGTIRIFVPDGTLVMDSCFETYRLAEWQAVGDRQIEWQEDTATIEAEITQLTSDSLQLTLALTNETRIENYRVATAPYVCPDMKR